MAPTGNLSPTRHGPALDPHAILQNRSSSAQGPVSPSSASSNGASITDKCSANHPLANRPKTSSSSSRDTQSSSNIRAENRAAQRDVRTLPSWIDSFEENENQFPRATDRLLLSPSRAHSARHHYNPASTERRRSQDGYVDDYDDAAHGMAEKRSETNFFGGHREPVKGRKWDHARQGDPVIMQSGVLPTSSPWRTFIQASMYGPGTADDGELKDERFLVQQTPGYEKPWRGDLEGNTESDTFASLLHNRKRQLSLLKRAQHTLLMHPLVPLIFRVIILTTSTIALAVSGSIHHYSIKLSYPQLSSTLMAIIVDAIAIPYVLYITWDEYTGKPLGLRSPKAKIRLVLLDLFFIIFESANLALAFSSLTDDNGACRSEFNGYNFDICSRVKTLCAFLLIALIAWSLTFAVSIFRLVDRVGGRDERD